MSEADPDSSAVEFYRAVLAAIDTHERPPVWAAAASALGNELMKVTGAGRADAVEEALRLYRRALRMFRRTERTEDAAAVEYNLGNAYRARLRGNVAASSARAIALFRRALQVRTRDAHPREWSWTMQNLAIALRTRPDGDPGANADEAIALGAEILAAVGDEDPGFRRAVTLNLASAWRTRPHGDPGENLEEAVRLLEGVVRGAPAASLDSAQASLALANALQSRVRGDRAENQERAIELYRAALRVYTRESHPHEWGLVMNNLGSLYRLRVHGRRDENLDRGIRLLQRALRVRTREADAVQWARSVSNLGNLLQDRRRGDRARNLERAIAAYEQALEVQRPDTLPLEWAQTANNLGACYSIRREGDPAANLRRSAQLLTATLAVRTRDALPLGWAEAHDNLGRTHERAIAAGVEHDARPAVAAYSAALEVYRPELLPADCRNVAVRLGRLLARSGQWSEAAAAFELALRATELLHLRALLPSGREAVLARAPELFQDAGYTLVRAGRVRDGVATLERGRARALGDALARERADLSQLALRHPDVYGRYAAAVDALRELERRARAERGRFSAGPAAGDAELRRHAEDARETLDRVTAEIAALPGFEHLSGTDAFAVAGEAAVPGRPLCYLVITAWGAAALLLARGEANGPPACHAVRIDTVKADDVDQLLERGGAGTGFAMARSGEMDRLGEALDRVLEGISPLMTAVAGWLASHGFGEVVLIPGGRLSLLPLHAVPCASGDRFSERFTVAYAPSARVLAMAQRAAPAPGRPTLFAVVDPAGSWAPLAYAYDEVDGVRGCFDPAAARVVDGYGATLDAVLQGITGASHVHFACHAVFDDQDPLASHLVLADDERLTMEQVLALPLAGTRLVALSACETAVHETTRLPDETVGLTAGFLQAGAAGVLATLWPVDDLAAALLVRRFYRNLLVHGRDPAAALAEAQRWLRELPEGDVAPALSGPLRTWHPRALRPRGATTERVGAVREARPFGHPLDWAAFVYVGA